MSEKKNVVVTGASRGIGLEFVRQWLAGGHRVIGTARKPKEATTLAALKKTAPDRLTILELDVADERSVKKFAEALHFEAIDVLINNAGVLLDDAKPYTKLNTDQLLETFNVNSLGPVRVINAVRPMLRASTRALVVNISSGAGSIAETDGSEMMVGYRMSKAALNMANKAIAPSLARDLVVSVAVCPGWVRTDMGGAHADLSPEESVSLMMTSISRLTLRDAGRYIDRKGVDIPW